MSHSWGSWDACSRASTAPTGAVELTHAGGQRMVVYMAPAGTPDHDALILLDHAGQDAIVPAP
jgi:hypothetical protein